ncbi:MAG: YcfL family protein [Phycisphaerae bacterium]|nr:YcfL family protein [Phycisphaerae bacterium]
MKKLFLLLFFVVSAVLLNGCTKEYKDQRVNLDTGVKSDNIVSNALTRPVYGAFNLLAGEGIKLTDVKVITNDAGFMEVQVTGYNRSVATKRFDYKVEWVNKNGIVIDSKAKVWQTISAKARNNFSFNVIAPSKDAVDFKMNTRKTPKKG